ncbi:MAG: hypothetical protein PHW21_01880, partial [Candidatus Izemoplasmatales bacterium]|nr:hypothetical protein [Candidatus Izemoplasmatales bacterium]
MKQKNYKKRRLIFEVIKYSITALGLLIMVIPMYYMIVSALKDNATTFIYPPDFFPSLKILDFRNFQYIIENVLFVRYLLNTLFVAFMTVLLSG